MVREPYREQPDCASETACRSSNTHYNTLLFGEREYQLIPCIAQSSLLDLSNIDLSKTYHERIA